MPVERLNPKNWFHSISFCSIKYQYLVKTFPTLMIDVSIWMTLSVLVYACALTVTVCINCHKRIGLCLHISICIFFFSAVGGGKGASKIKKKINEKEGGLGAKPPRSQSILMPEKEMEIIFVTPLYGFINEILTPPPPFGVDFFSCPLPQTCPAPPPLSW